MKRAALFLWPVTLSVATLATVWLLAGPSATAVAAILGVLEVSLSFDNAVVNASVLRRMPAVWHTLFLTVGVAIAVFGMRLAFPFIVVTATSGLNPDRVLDLARDDPAGYAAALRDAHPAIASFGSAFLLTVFLTFLFDEHETHWLAPIERFFARFSRLRFLPTVLALLAVAAAAAALPARMTQTVLVAGALGVATHLAVHLIGNYFGRREAGDGRRTLVTGRAAAALFVYLEILDASFSFDGVIGAFAISSDIFVIAAGLGIGALYIRGLTVYFVRYGTLDSFAYLEHGAFYAIGALAVILQVSIVQDLPDLFTGLVGVAILALALASSLPRRRATRAGAGPPTVPDSAVAASPHPQQQDPEPAHHEP